MTIPFIKGKIGLGVITCNRVGFFKECIAAIPESDVLVIVNDGEAYEHMVYPSWISKVIQHSKNEGVGRSKNEALRYLLKEGCEHIFICEDDLRVVNPDICKEYIEASKSSGILHFNFAYHGPENRFTNGTRMPPRKVVNLGDSRSIGLFRNLLAAFQYFRADVLLTTGFFDPVFKNMIEHIDHTLRIIKDGFHPPFWWFADLEESYRFIEDLDPTHSRSASHRDQWSYRFRLRYLSWYFFIKHGYRIGDIPDSNEKEVDQLLARIQLKYGISSQNDTV